MKNLNFTQPDSAILAMEDDLTIQNISVLKEVIEKSLGLVRNLTITHPQVSRIDLSYLQLIISAHITARYQQRNLCFHFDKQGLIDELLERSGAAVLRSKLFSSEEEIR